MIQAQAPTLEELLNRDVAQWLPALGRVLEEQAAQCAALEALSIEQSRSVATGRTDELMGVLSRRQRVIDNVTRLNRELEPFRSRKVELLGALSTHQRNAVVQRVGQIAALVESVRARDDQDRIVIEKMRSAVGDELAMLSRARGAAAAYGAASQPRPVDVPRPRYQDRQA